MSDESSIDDVGANAGTDVPAQEYLISIAQEIGRLDSEALYFYPIILILLIAAVFYFTRRQRWIKFCHYHKAWSRISLFFAMLFILIFSAASNDYFLSKIRGKLAPEFPNMTITAIKIGMYGLEFRQQLATRVPPEQKDMFNCVLALSYAEAKDFADSCRGVKSCMNSMPHLSKQDIINEIRDIKAGKIVANDQMHVCYGIKIE